MNLYVVFLELCGAIVLLLFAVRMVRTGVERSQRPALERLLARSSGNRLRTAGIGLGVAALLQSSTAVALLAAGFAASGALSVATGLTLMLGADLGSALVARVLSVPVDWLVPALIVLGGGLFFRGPSRRMRQGGRILMGVALILVSLRMLGEATAPLRDLPMLPQIVGYLAGDPFTAFLIGAAFTWLVHSSVASILLFAAFAAQGIVPVEVGACLVLGANLGGGLIAVGLTRQGPVEARRIVLGNMVFRGAGAALALVLLRLFPVPLDWLGPDVAQQMINLHLVFNAVLLVVCLPLVGPVARLATRMVRPATDPASPLAPAASCLDVSVVDQPRLALASAKRELMRMAEIVERMLTPVMELYETGDPEKIAEVRRLELAVNRAQSDIKLYLARIEYADGMMEEARRGRDLAGFTINLEHVGDAITKTLLKLAETRRDQGLKFSPAGWRELKELHDRALSNMRLAFNVLVSEDREAARQLIAQQTAMDRAGNASAASHLDRLRSGTPQSIATSNLHLETVRALNTVATLLTPIAHQILERSQGEPDGHNSA